MNNLLNLPTDSSLHFFFHRAQLMLCSLQATFELESVGKLITRDWTLILFENIVRLNLL